MAEDDPPHICGIQYLISSLLVTQEGEFTSDTITNADDWEATPYRVFLGELDESGITPLRGTDERDRHYFRLVDS